MNCHAVKMAIEKNVLYGGVEGPPMDADAKSVGELVLKKLAEYEQETVLVSNGSLNIIFFISPPNYLPFCRPMAIPASSYQRWSCVKESFSARKVCNYNLAFAKEM